MAASESSIGSFGEAKDEPSKSILLPPTGPSPLVAVQRLDSN